jgi:hypothetical protein
MIRTRHAEEVPGSLTGTIRLSIFILARIAIRETFARTKIQEDWQGKKMRLKQYSLMLMLPLVVLCVSNKGYAAQTKIHGEYCYQYGDSESLMIAKEISYTMALRKAIETYQAFVASTSVVQDFRLRNDLVETIASGYIENIKIVRQDIEGRNVCTGLIGDVNPDVIKSIVARKISVRQRSKSKEFEGIAYNDYVKILNYYRNPIDKYHQYHMIKDFYDGNYASFYLNIVYQAKVNLPPVSNKIIVDCFDKNGNPIQGTRKWIPPFDVWQREVMEVEILLPKKTASFELRVVSLKGRKTR